MCEENNINLNIHTIDRILNIFRKIIVHYLKDYYKFNKLGKSSRGSNISMDEFMFGHNNGEKNWAIGAKNDKTGNIRLDIFKTLNQNYLKYSLIII